MPFCSGVSDIRTGRPLGAGTLGFFLNHEPAPLLTHRGKFVAIHDGEVVDSDADEVQLGLRVYGKYGDVPICFGLVSESPLPPVRVPSPRLRRTAGHG